MTFDEMFCALSLKMHLVCGKMVSTCSSNMDKNFSFVMGLEYGTAMTKAENPSAKVKRLFVSDVFFETICTVSVYQKTPGCSIVTRILFG